jgi:DNA polymerase phi
MAVSPCCGAIALVLPHGLQRALTRICAQTADAEALLLAVKLADRLSPTATARCPLLAASSSALFSKQHLDALLPALLSSTAAHPRVHSVWPALVERLSREKPGAAQVFWEVACENSLFCSSHERKCVIIAADSMFAARTHRALRRFLGFKLFSMLLPTLHGHDVAALFSPNFMRCLVNSLTNEDTLLHASASLCLTNVRDAALLLALNALTYTHHRCWTTCVLRRAQACRRPSSRRCNASLAAASTG